MAEVNGNHDKTKSTGNGMNGVETPKHTKQRSSIPSEFDQRASSMRSRIEQKLDEIEAKISLQNEVFEDNCKGDTEVKDVIQNRQLTDSRRSRSCSVAEMKESAISRLKEELDNAQKELKLKDEEVTKLSRVRDEVGSEIEDLTASLFEEANNMVYEANVKRSTAEKHAKEANMKLNVLQDEVAALKALIQASIPCISNDQTPSSDSKSASKKMGSKTSSSSDLQCKPSDDVNQALAAKERYEPDPILHREFVSWRQTPAIDKTHAFLKRIYEEDIDPCMNFENDELSKNVLLAIEEGRISIEYVSDKSSKVCALLQTPRFCQYRMNLGNEEEYYSISTLSRNRIAAICDFFCYLKYIEKGLITHSIHEVYFEVLKKRRAIMIARLGLPNESGID